MSPIRFWIQRLSSGNLSEVPIYSGNLRLLQWNSHAPIGNSMTGNELPKFAFVRQSWSVVRDNWFPLTVAPERRT